MYEPGSKFGYWYTSILSGLPRASRPLGIPHVAADALWRLSPQRDERE